MNLDFAALRPGYIVYRIHGAAGGTDGRDASDGGIANAGGRYGTFIIGYGGMYGGGVDRTTYRVVT